eukprot:scaffold6609_cov34-Tisochrysis_lutea.AAC.8
MHGSFQFVTLSSIERTLQSAGTGPADCLRALALAGARRWPACEATRPVAITLAFGFGCSGGERETRENLARSHDTKKIGSLPIDQCFFFNPVSSLQSLPSLLMI